MPAERLAVAVVVTHPRDASRVLVVRRAADRPAPGYWTPVTGGVEPGESLEEACVREVAEEVGLRVEVSSAERFRCPVELRTNWVLIWFRARVVEGEDPDTLVLAERELADARWVALDTLDGLEPMFDNTRRGFATVLGAAAG